MTGVFIHRKITSWILFLDGLVLTALYIFLSVVDPQVPAGFPVLLIMGIAFSLLTVPSLLHNHGAYLHVEEGRIKARYNWFGKLDCSVDEVDFVMAQEYTLLFLLKNGKRCSISAVENAWPLCAAIRRQTFAPEREAPGILQEKLNRLQAEHKRAIWWMIGCMGLMFAGIFITVWLTGGRDLDAFSQTDWVLLSVMGVLEAAICAGLFYVADKCGKQLLPIEWLKYRLRSAAIVSQPLPSNIILRIYTDEALSSRIVVCGLPNDESVYYCTQEWMENYQLKTVYTSEIFNSRKELPEDEFAVLIDITAPVLAFKKNCP